MYYRIYDLQTSRYMATGYNTKSEKDLQEQFLSYLSIDHTNYELLQLKKLPIRELLSIYEFQLEESETIFEEHE